MKFSYIYHYRLKTTLTVIFRPIKKENYYPPLIIIFFVGIRVSQTYPYKTPNIEWKPTSGSERSFETWQRNSKLGGKKHVARKHDNSRMRIVLWKFIHHIRARTLEYVGRRVGHRLRDAAGMKSNRVHN